MSRSRRAAASACFARRAGLQIQVPALRVIVGPSGAQRSTAAMVDHVAQTASGADDTRLRELGELADTGTTTLRSGDLPALGSTMDRAHALLGELGVSTRLLDGLCESARSAGAYGAKLTGAGGGGAVIAIAPRWTKRRGGAGRVEDRVRRWLRRDDRRQPMSALAIPTTGTASARACANIALVKYWGKRDAALNLPATGSLSLAAGALVTETTVTFDPALRDDALVLDGAPADASRVRGFLEIVRGLASITTRARVDTRNQFPTASGLASSASGFAALAMAATRAAGIELTMRDLSLLCTAWLPICRSIDVRRLRAHARR